MVSDGCGGPAAVEFLAMLCRRAAVAEANTQPGNLNGDVVICR